MTAAARIRSHGPRTSHAATDAATRRRGRMNIVLALGASTLVAVYALSGSILAATTWQLRDSQMRLGVVRAAHDGVVADIAKLDDREALTALAGRLGMGEIAATYIVESAPVAAAR